MKKIIILYLFISIKLFGTNNDSLIVKYFLSNKTKEILYFDSFNFCNKKIEFSRKGNIESINEYLNDTNFVTKYYSSGNLMSKSTLVKNQRQGKYLYFLDLSNNDSTYKIIMNFKNDKIDGQSITLKLNSNLKYDTLEIFYFVNGKQIGPTFNYFGNKIIISYYFNGKTLAELAYYKHNSSLGYRIKKRRLKKYNISLEKIFEDIKIIIPNFKPYQFSESKFPFGWDWF